MTSIIQIFSRFRPVYFAVWLFIPLFGCGHKTTPANTNLIENPSFEEQRDGLPAHWTLENFHGLEGDKEVAYGIDSDVAYDGESSFFFKGEQDTRRWYALSQELSVRDVSHAQFKGAIRLNDVRRRENQYFQCNFAFTFYDEKHHRFQETRFGDQWTRLKIGTTDWVVEDLNFRVPKGTAYIKVQCVMGMSGTVWFDDLSLTIPESYDWNTAETKNFNFHWMDERPFPTGAMKTEQDLFDRYCRQLGVTSDQRIDYYLYPDSATIRKMLNLKGVIYVSWTDKEIHTISPVEEHEIVHIITDPYGMPPRAICEGTVYYLQGQCLGQPFHPIARRLLGLKRLPSLAQLTSYNSFINQPGEISLPAVSSFVAFVCDTWGANRLIELYQADKGENTRQGFSRAFEEVYKIPLDEAEVRWHQFLVRGSFLQKNASSAESPADTSATGND